MESESSISSYGSDDKARRATRPRLTYRLAAGSVPPNSDYHLSFGPYPPIVAPGPFGSSYPVGPSGGYAIIPPYLPLGTQSQPSPYAEAPDGPWAPGLPQESETLERDRASSYTPTYFESTA